MIPFRPCLTATVVALAAQPIWAGQPMPPIEEIVQVSLISGWRDAEGREIGALAVELAPGWKTYWRVGGESGLPPVFDWSASSNLDAVTYHWPSPELFVLDGMHVLGFHDSLVLPITFAPVTAGEPMRVSAVLDLGVCREVCVPVRAEITSDFSSASGADRTRIEVALARQPRDARASGLADAVCVVEQVGQDVRISAQISLGAGAADGALVVFETPEENLWIAPAVARAQGAMLTAEALAMNFTGHAVAVEPGDIRITLIGAGPVLEFLGCAE
jgi:DsbC/DsbD-like thiol-disulfide interchange protein